MHARVLEAGKGVLFREVSSVQMHARVLEAGKGVLFREVSSVQMHARVLEAEKGVCSHCTYVHLYSELRGLFLTPVMYIYYTCLLGNVVVCT